MEQQTANDSAKTFKLCIKAMEIIEICDEVDTFYWYVCIYLYIGSDPPLRGPKQLAYDLYYANLVHNI